MTQPSEKPFSFSLPINFSRAVDSQQQRECERKSSSESTATLSISWVLNSLRFSAKQKL